MKQSTFKLLVLILTLIIVIGGSVLLYRSLGSQVQPEVSSSEPAENLAPDFTVLDASDGIYSLSGFRGKPVILNFWSSRCGPCKQEMPYFQQAWEEYGDEVEFMMVNLTDGFNDTFASARELIEKQGYTFPVYFDSEASAASVYQITAMPVTVFIDAEGRIVSKHMGMMTPDQLTDAIQSLVTD